MEPDESRIRYNGTLEMTSLDLDKVIGLATSAEVHAQAMRLPPAVLAEYLENRIFADKVDYPQLRLPEWAQIKVMFPIAGCAAHFRISHRQNPNAYASVLLDTANTIGHVLTRSHNGSPQPYFEVKYPAGEIVRFDMDEVDTMMVRITERLLAIYSTHVKEAVAEQKTQIKNNRHKRKVVLKRG